MVKFASNQLFIVGNRESVFRAFCIRVSAKFLEDSVFIIQNYLSNPDVIIITVTSISNCFNFCDFRGCRDFIAVVVVTMSTCSASLTIT